MEIGADSTFNNDINFAAEHLFEILLQHDLIQQRTSGGELNEQEQVDVTVGTRFTARRRSEHADVCRSVPLRDLENILAILF